MHYTFENTDTYIILKEGLVSDVDKFILNTLYLPLIGSRSVILFSTFLSSFPKLGIMSTEETIAHLITVIAMSKEELSEALVKLEAIGLLKTYKKDNNYIFRLYNPLSPYEFFNHHLIAPLLYYNLGKNEFNLLKSKFQKPEIDLKGYSDETHKFSDIFQVIDESIKESNIRNNQKGEVLLANNIDFKMILEGIPSYLYNKATFNADNKELINVLSFLYKIDEIKMGELIRESLNNKVLNEDELKKKARVLYNFNNYNKPQLIYKEEENKTIIKPKNKKEQLIKDFENISPYDYLKSKYDNVDPSLRELKIIEDLLLNFHLSAGVVNVLISYVLKVNNSKFTKSYVEAIASQWARLKIQTVEEAMRVSEEEYKKQKARNNKVTYKKRKNNVEVPSWTKAGQSKEEISEDESSNLKEMLQDFIN